MSDGLYVTDVVPPICTRHSESMVLSFYDRPGSPPGNGYTCRSCMAERTQQGMNVYHDPAKSLLKPLPPSEKAELQVSLLNEIGLTLTAMAKEQVAQSVSMVTAFASHTQRLKNIADDRDRDHQLYRQMDERIQGLGLSMAGDYTSLAQKIFDLAETQDAQRKSLEEIQGLLVDLEHSLDVIAEVQANSYDAVVTKFMHIEKCLTYIEECAKRGRVRGDETCGRLSAIEGHLERLISGRKTGKTARKRPVRKAGKRLKTSKL